MNTFKANVFESIRTDFYKYLDLKDRANTTITKKRYMDDLEVYIKDHLTDRTMLESYIEIFNKSDLKGFLTTRKSITAKYAISNLLQFYHFNKKINDTEYLDIKNELKKYKSTKKDNMDFLTSEDFTFIFGSRINYKKESEHETIQLLRLIMALSYNCMFEQNHIFEIMWSDIDLSKKIIKNKRAIEQQVISDWIEIEDYTYNLLCPYQVSTKNRDYLFANLKTDKNSINNLLRILNNRVKNSNNISTRVNLQKIIRSRILIDLIKSDGKDLMKFYKIFGLIKDTQLNTAIKEYLILENSKMANSIR